MTSTLSAAVEVNSSWIAFESAADELRQGLSGLLDREISRAGGVTMDGAIVLATSKG